MKKHGLLLAVALFMSVAVNAQLFEYGIKGGLNFGSLPMDEITEINSASGVYSLATGESVRGYQVGLMTRINVAMVFVQPEVYFNAVGGTVEKVATGGATELMDVTFNRIDIPVLVGAKIGPLKLNVGPVGSAVISSVNELVELSSDFDNITNNFTFGYQAGLGIDLLGKLAIDFRYEGSLQKFQETINIDGGLDSFTFDARPRSFILAFGWWF